MTVSHNPGISLSGHHRALVDALVESGRYHGVSEVVREGLRLLEDQEAWRARALAEIDAVLREGLYSRSAGRRLPQRIPTLKEGLSQAL
jgi:putative addiction module CopG family antidote